ncbi:SURF1 family protein [Piscinibacter aquaticus]|uniref:SURF1-like protein n=1 Tax=Piscinibacter aquaticus TaxID=392597 RepID=A0A5C6TXY4_9BURK|nr:SURF1 family protein [Piscinibacter aquaticus]
MNVRGRSLVVLLAAVIAAGITARLGVWQLSRAAQKESLQASLDSRGAAPPLAADALARSTAEAANQHHRRITLEGRWVSGRTVYLDNRPMDGRAGFYVVTPLALPDGDAVLVQRGWVPRHAADRSRLPAVATPEGMVRIEGRIAPPPSRLFELGAEQQGLIRQNLDVDAFGRETGLRLRPLSVQQTDMPGAPADGLLRSWPAPAVDVHKHYGYAFQWFALASLITGLYVWFQLVRPRLRRRA